MSMEQSGGGSGGLKRAKVADGAGGEDRLSALPDDVLILILLRLCIEDAARTSVLSRRWRRIWTLLPELRFGIVRDPRLLREFLSASVVPLRLLRVCFLDASPKSLSACLSAAVCRVSGELVFSNLVTGIPTGDDEDEDSQRGTFELPCFEKATSIYLDLGFLCLAMPPAGVFARLTDLDLSDVMFHSPGQLEDAVSSLRCPCLQKLAIRSTKGLDSITIDSESLQLLELRDLRGVQQVTVVAPALEDFALAQCFIIDQIQNQPVVNISAPQLKFLKWADAFDPSSVHLGSMEHLQKLGTFFFVYGQHGIPNHDCLMLLQRFKAIEYLILSLGYLTEIDNLHYLMEDMTMLPDVTCLKLIVMAKGHAIGACSFHILRLCSGIKRLTLILSSQFDLEEQTVCSSGCICDQPTNWKTEDLSLNCLQELEIEGFGASEHEVAFMKRLLNWVTVLKMMTVTFRHSVTENKAKEFFQMCRSFSRPGVCMKFYIYQNFNKVSYAPKD